MLFLLKIFLDAALNPHDASEEDECERRQNNQIVGHIARRHDLEPEECAASKKLTEEGHDKKDHAVTGTVRQTVEQ